MVVVLLAVHAQDRRAEDQADRVVVLLRAEQLVVAEGPKTLLKSNSVHSFVGRSSGGVMRGVHDRAAPHRLGLAHVREVGVRIARQIQGDRLIVRIGADRHLCLPGEGI